ncbi:MurR/RpiR family transcriptional regulator [Thermicanus aegyptius]|uniref:MurR/RpiR family transcriptional regulator n=1 Tax=Thermicanus aegyptius TaxID=94009 RepID=UPI000426C0E6|nr:MurR/RpiR family transcriptional regulator [Thermicanus aegyptius]
MPSNSPETPFQTVRHRIDHVYERLSPSQKKAAAWIRSHSNLAAILTAKEIGIEAGVSEATVHRLVASMGYKSFFQLRETLQQELLVDRTLVRLNQRKSMEPKSYIEQTMRLECQNIQETLSHIEDAIRAAAERITGAERVYVAGWRSGLAVSAPLSYQLNLILGNTMLLPAGGELSERVAFLTGSDVLIAVAFPRYCKTTYRLVQEAKSMNTQTIIFTDAPISPFYAFADVALFAKTDSFGFLDSYAAPLILAQLLVQEVANQAPERVKRNLQKQEQLFRDWKLI